MSQMYRMAMAGVLVSSHHGHGWHVSVSSTLLGIATDLADGVGGSEALSGGRTEAQPVSGLKRGRGGQKCGAQ